MQRALLTASLVAAAAVAAAGEDTVLLGEPVRVPWEELEAMTAGPAPVPPGVPSGGFSVNATSRNAVVAFYHEVYQASEGIPAEWTGYAGSCDEGTIGTNYLASILRRIHYFRAMAGLPTDIALDTNWNQACQEAALMMSANTNLDHHPPPTWTCWTWAGSNAASKADLALGTHGGPAITAFILDAGPANYPCGHRRWLLYPLQQTMGIGSLPASNGYLSACVVQVIGGFGSRPADPKYVPWPNEGYVPYELAFQRWSFSASNGLFGAATVNMTSNGTPIGVVLETVATGYGDNTIVWKPDGFPLSSIPSDTVFQVSISNVLFGVYTNSYTYNVILIDPYTIPEVIRIDGSPTPCVSNANIYAFEPVPAATAYVIRVSLLIPGTWFEGAEEGSNNVTPCVVGGYAFISSNIVASGSNSFHLAGQWTQQYFVLDRVLRPRAASVLTFKTRMRWNTVTQYASAELSTDNGTSWTVVWQKNGIGGDTDPAFETHNIDVSAYADRQVKVRFTHCSSNTSYIGTSDQHGVFVDDVALSNSQELVDTRTETVFTNFFTLVPSNTADCIIEAAPFLGGRQFNFGEARIVKPLDLLITEFQVGGGGAVVRFNAQTGVVFELYRACEVLSGAWGSPLTSGTAYGTSVTVTDTAASATSPGVYRVLKP